VPGHSTVERCIEYQQKLGDKHIALYPSIVLWHVADRYRNVITVILWLEIDFFLYEA